MSNQIQQEVFALPINNKLVATIDGNKLYSNDSLRNSYIEAMESMESTKNISSEIKRLVEKRKIVPCWLNKGVLRLIAYKVFAPSSVKGISGFYHPTANKLFLLIDNNIMFGYAPNKFLATLTVHEMTHMYAHEQPRKFLNLYMNELESWYYHFLVDYLDLDISKKDLVVKDLVNFLFRKIERDYDGPKRSAFKEYHKRIMNLCKPLTTMDEMTFNRSLDDLIMFCTIFSRNQNDFIKVYRNYKKLVQAMYEAYKHAFGLRNLTTLCIQELLYPSEVASIYTEVIKDQQKIKSIFKRS